MNLETGKIQNYNPYMSVSVKEAKNLYGLRDKDIEKIDTDNDSNISLKELKAAGLSNYKELATHFNEQTKGVLFEKENISFTSQVNATNPKSFTHNAFNKKASLFNPEHRDNNNVAILGDAVTGKNLYLLG